MVLSCLGLSIYGNGDSRILRWCPFVLGPISGLVYMLVRNAVVKLRLHDPLEVVAIHLVPGRTSKICCVYLVFRNSFLETGSLGLTLIRLFIWVEDYFLIFGWSALWVILVFLWALFSGLLIFGVMSCAQKLKLRSVLATEAGGVVANALMDISKNMIEMDEVVGKS